MEIYEYVHSIGNRMFPTYEIEEDGKEYQVDTACTGDFIVPHKDGKTGYVEIPFYQRAVLGEHVSNSFVTGIGHRHRKNSGWHCSLFITLHKRKQRT